MQSQKSEPPPRAIAFGRRKVIPSVCVIDDKQHVRTFLGEALEELGLLTLECQNSDALNSKLDCQHVDLVVMGLSAGGLETRRVMACLASRSFDGQVLVLGPTGSPLLAAVHQLASELGIAMLPTLSTPFGAENLRASVATLLPVAAAPSAPVNVAEALKSGWLELWYQSKVDTRTLAPCGAEALIRMRHPSWGVVPPAYFIPDDGDPHFRGLSEFVITKALDDWQYFLGQNGPVDLSINLPVSFLENPAAVDDLCLQIPRHPAFSRLMIEINGSEIVGNLDQLIDVAKQIRFHNIAISLGSIGAEWPSLMGLDNFPFTEIKVDREFIAGCADDRLKRSVCHRIIDLAESYGARTVAEGVETRADLVAVHEMGFNMAQGCLFGKPAIAKKFARSALSRPLAVPI